MITKIGEELCKEASVLGMLGGAALGLGKGAWWLGKNVGKLGTGLGTLGARGLDSFGQYALKHPVKALGIAGTTLYAANKIPQNVERYTNNVDPTKPYWY